MSDQSKKIIIFDIDGTICDTQQVEGRCFEQAIKEVCGVSLETLDWTQYDEPTSSGVVRSILGDDPDLTNTERLVRDRFVEILMEEQPRFPGDFSPLPGAAEFVSLLSADPTISVAFATGAFDTEAEFKLKCCGIDLSMFPHATSSDTPRRRDIIPLAAKRAGFEISSAVYFGDAPWDLGACKHLGIPMIGIGRRIEHLRKLGLETAFRDFSDPDGLLRKLNAFHGAAWDKYNDSEC